LKSRFAHTSLRSVNTPAGRAVSTFDRRAHSSLD